MWTTAAKPCDCCRSAAAMLFCRDENSFMCMICDAKLHSACHKHAKVWLCGVCEHAPASVTCKADAASLCVTCDRDIHAANPLARRHERVPVVPFFDTAESVLILNHVFVGQGQDQDPKVDDPWMIPDPGFGGSKYPADNPELKSMEFFFADSDQFLEFENFVVSSQPFSDSVVPVQTSTRTPLFSSPENRFEIDFTKSNITSFNNNSSSTFTTPSSEVGVVPDGSGSALSDISYPVMKNSVPVQIANTDMSNGYQIGMDREARVLRYREKRKSRKFEKTVRYASRKAYAETRPRVKGRFAKRVDSKSESENIMFGAGSGSFVKNDRYGVVPSF